MTAHLGFKGTIEIVLATDVGPLEGRLSALEPLRVDHAQPLWDAANRLPVLPVSFVPTSRHDVDRFIADAMVADADGRSCHFVVRAAGDQVVGTTAFLDPQVWFWPPGNWESEHNGLPDSVEIGATWLVPSTWGTGVNVETKLLMLTHAFECWKTTRVQLCTDVRNARSRRAIEAIGAMFEGVRRSDRPGPDGTIRDSAIYAFTRFDWPQIASKLAAQIDGHLSA